MKKAWAIILLVIMVFSTLAVVTSGAKGSVKGESGCYWFKDYRGPAFNSTGPTTDASDIAFAPDGDIIVAGDTDIFGAGQIDTWVMKLDKCGSIVWQKSYGGSGDDIASSVAIAPNGDIIIAGWTGGSFSSDDGDWDLWVLRLNENGSIIWQKNYGGSVNDGYSTVSLAIALNGDIIVASSTLMDDDYKDMWLLRLDGNGNVKWEKTYGGEYDDDYAEAVSIAPNGDIVVAGVTWVYGNGGGAWVLRLDSDGNIKWQNVYGRSMALDLASGLTIDSNGNIIVSGSTGSLSGTMDGWLLYLDGNGGVKWSKSYIGYTDSAISELAIAPNGDIIGTGGYYVLRVSENGTLEWAKWMIDGDMVGPEILSDGTAAMAGGEAHAFTVGRFNIDEVPQYSGWHNPEDVDWDGWGDVDLEVSDISMDVVNSVVESSAMPRLFNATVNNISAEIHNASATVTTTTVWCSTTLTAPQNLQATSGSGKVTLSWDPPADDGGCNIIEYRIYRSTASGGEVYYTSVNGSTTTYTDNDVVNGQTYYYKVSAVNTVCEGPKSNEASATVNVVTTEPSAPSTPQNLKAMADGGYVTLSWSPPVDDGGSNITQYKIYRGTTSGGETYLASVNSSTTTYTDTSVTNGHTYYYQVSAVNAAGEGPKSNEVSITPTVGGGGGVVTGTITDQEGKTVVTYTASGTGNLTAHYITKEELPAPSQQPPEGAVSIGIYFEMTMENLSWVNIAVYYNESDLPEGVSEEDLGLYFWNETSSMWDRVEDCSVDTERNVIRANVTHMTVFAAFAGLIQNEVEGGSTTGNGSGQQSHNNENGSNYVVWAVVAVLIIIAVVIVGLFVLKKNSQGR